MNFVSSLALAVALLVVAPYVAHRLRRTQAEPRLFGPVRFLSASPPNARRKSALEDRALFWLRASSVFALALLGASPLVHCSQLTLSRGGASVAVAIVIDDSMSMRAVRQKGGTRFDAAKTGAKELVASLREGDSAALVLAGAPIRVALAPSTDLAYVKNAINELKPSDRATDLDAALAAARSLLSRLPQVDRRIVLLSDLADGKSDGPPLGEGGDVWFPTSELVDGDAQDCAVLTADRSVGNIRVRIACTSPKAAEGRSVVIKDGDSVVADARIEPAVRSEVFVPVTGRGDRPLDAVLTGSDAIASDDRARMIEDTGHLSVAVVTPQVGETLGVQGSSVVEQALSSLRAEAQVRAVPSIADRVEDASRFGAIIIDDPAGFSPEERRVLSEFVDRGGVLLLSLGARAASAPIGTSFSPVLSRSVTVARSGEADKGFATALLGADSASLVELGVRSRGVLASEDAMTFEPALKWADGGLLVGRRSMGKGEVWISTVSFSVEDSDFVLRPPFLVLLDAVLSAAKARSVPSRTDVGMAWDLTAPRTKSLSVLAPDGTSISRPEERRFVADLIGTYTLLADDKREVRVASAIAHEVDFRPRAVGPVAAEVGRSSANTQVDISWVVALALLLIVSAEIVVRSRVSTV